MGSQNRWFGDPRTLRHTHPNPSFLEGPSWFLGYIALVAKFGNLRKFWSFFSFIPFLLWFWTSFFTSLHPKKGTSSTVLFDALDPQKCGKTQPRWWFQTFFILTPIPGEMIQFDHCNIFKMGWNHQLATYWVEMSRSTCWVFLRHGVVRCFHHAWPLVRIQGTRDSGDRGFRETTRWSSN